MRSRDTSRLGKRHWFRDGRTYLESDGQFAQSLPDRAISPGVTFGRHVTFAFRLGAIPYAAPASYPIR
ncbi:hypothetical protein GCM10011400_72440 [Paraburkholderia caffeinilytica]|uniref:Uncharacterized protein n=1 Tax=Paraburkholderia caffeinilytica TaxID=1761016 RepID=A0ABQ1NDV6_9BURK|nr:hypothetical protein GCM10011400_72440 [Paraburkholderia caffeinilytica]